MSLPSQGSPGRGPNRKIRKLLGHSYLREQRIGEALEVYLGLLHDDPRDVDVLALLGNLYDLSGAPRAAAALYAQVLRLAPENQLAARQLALAEQKPDGSGEESDPLQPEALRRLAARLTAGLSAENGTAIRAAADSLEQGPGEAAQPGPDPARDAELLMAALVETTVRKARAEGQPELAAALQSLLRRLSRRGE